MNYQKTTGLHLCLLLNFGRPRAWKSILSPTNFVAARFICVHPRASAAK